MDRSNTALFEFTKAEDANDFREIISKMGLRWARPIYWHDKNLPFPKTVTGASCFFLRLESKIIGITAAHVFRLFENTKSRTPSLLFQINLVPFNLDEALIDIDDQLDIATFEISEKDVQASLSEPIDVSVGWPADTVVKRGAAIQLVCYPENIRTIDPADRSAIFQAWGALDVIQDFSQDEIIIAYDPLKVHGAPTKPPLGYNMSGCSGGPAIIHEDRGGLHCWYPIGLIIAGPKASEGEAVEFDLIRVRRINCIEPDGRLRRSAPTGWLPT
jgi:hypothetical protein